jgi:hypothetical protein
LTHADGPGVTSFAPAIELALVRITWKQSVLDGERQALLPPETRTRDTPAPGIVTMTARR